MIDVKIIKKIAAVILILVVVISFISILYNFVGYVGSWESIYAQHDNDWGNRQHERYYGSAIHLSVLIFILLLLPAFLGLGYLLDDSEENALENKSDKRRALILRVSLSLAILSTVVSLGSCITYINLRPAVTAGQNFVGKEREMDQIWWTETGVIYAKITLGALISTFIIYFASFVIILVIGDIESQRKAIQDKNDKVELEQLKKRKQFEKQNSVAPVHKTDTFDAEILEEAKESEKQTEYQKQPQNFDNYILPLTEFLTAPPPPIEQKKEELLAIAQELTGKTKEFNVTGRVMHICQGPVVTTYEFKPDPGVKYSRVTGLSDDLCLALKAESIRIDRIPGKAFVGIEVPNRERETIFLREVIESPKFKQSKSLLTIALGKTIDGANYITDLAKMPHLLIAGTTGAGKSVCLNTLIISILYKAKPDEVKFILIDTKRIELGLYDDIPHLATPIITDPKRAAISLKWAVSEMEKRYKELADWGVRNIDGYNSEVENRNQNEQFDHNGEPYKKFPYIVIIIDEFADLMLVSDKEFEDSVIRLAQMARAVGIHLVLATQKPSSEVITGLIKTNFPARIAFHVPSRIDSRTILDANGAENLLGKGDMLFLSPATSQIVRIHGTFVDEKEINQIVTHVKAQGNPEYDTTTIKTEEELTDTGELPGRKDVLFIDALRTVAQSKRASTSLLQRHLRIGYGRAAAILDAMVHEGYIGDVDGSSRARPILQKAYDDLQEAEEGREL